MRRAESNLNRRDWLPFTNWILRWMFMCVSWPRMTQRSCFVHFRIQFFSPDRAMSMSHEFTCPPVIINYYFRILCSQIPSNKWHSINVPLTIVDRRMCCDWRRFVRSCFVWNVHLFTLHLRELFSLSLSIKRLNDFCSCIECSMIELFSLYLYQVDRMWLT